MTTQAENIPPEALSRDELLYQRLALRSVSRLDFLPTTAWSKVIALEKDHVMAKVYVNEISLMVTGSKNPFDDVELGLGAFVKDHTEGSTRWAIRNLSEGVEIKRNIDGSVLARRLCNQPITVQLSNEGYLSEDLIGYKGVLPLDRYVKVFDMKEFRSLIFLRMVDGSFSPDRLLARCVVGLNFGHQSINDGVDSTPCWIAVVPLNALRLLEDRQALHGMSLATANFGMENEEELKLQEEQNKAKAKKQRQVWSRSDRREHLKMRGKNDRTLREELRDSGEKICDHMPYSWEEQVDFGPVIHMDQLYEKLRAQSKSPMEAWGPASYKQWAKVEVLARQLARDLVNMEAEESVDNR